MRRSFRLETLEEHARSSVWLVPSLFVLLAVAAAETLARVGAPASWGWPGDVQSAQTLLQLLGGSVITVTSLTFSLAVVALQLASSQFSPRLLRTFVRERVFQVTLGVFLATFVYCVTLLRWVTAQAPLPRMALFCALVLAVASVAALVWFLARILKELRVEAMIADAHREAAHLIPQVYPDLGQAEEPLPEAPPEAVPLRAAQAGFVQGVDADALLRWAVAHGAVVRVDVTPGDRVVKGSAAGLVWPLPGSNGAADPDRLEELGRSMAAKTVEIGFERTPQQDAAFGFRQLVDIVVKAMSPAINDPTTATHAIAFLADLLNSVAQRDLGTELIRDDHGNVRVAAARRTFEYFLDLSCGQPRRFGGREPAVAAAVIELLRVVGTSLDAEDRRRAVVEELDRVVRTAERQLEDEHDIDKLRQAAAAAREYITAREPA